MQSPISKILITGTTGFVGQALCRQLVKENYSIRILLRDISQAGLLPANLEAEYVVGDITDIDSMQSACANMDAVIHLAGVAHVSNDSSELSNKVNVEGMGNLIKMANEQKLKRFVFLSSSLAEAAENEKGDVTHYGKEKRAAEKLLQKIENTFDYIILRSVNVYGRGMKGNIAGMISLIYRGRLPRLPQLRSKISLLGVDDLARGLLLSLKAEDIVNKTYAITDGQAYSISDIEEAIYNALGKRLPRWRTPAVVLYLASAAAGLLSKVRGRSGSISSRTYRNLTTDNLFENEKICKDLAFEPGMTLYQALPGIVEEIKNR
ncbi:MAG: hypothetical protein COA96_02600 [SAR86 cluster bacterium]|uniref:NAD-dependent epimerase/dehydratase domain-containing protein n=1 Tax=SAR86 cluster bacterium TaxID=2030880 RepID=A0A2A5B8R2_9GAMM|nr:MAG: hypothetical protein COA96_02600 [SAR86 cluster bacterium]